MDYRRIVLLFFLVFGFVLIPAVSCQESSTALDVSAYPTVDDLSYEEGKLSQGSFRLSIGANSDFGIVIFSPTLDYSTRLDSRTTFSDGWYSISQDDYFPRGLEIDFNYAESGNEEILEYGILFGINITAPNKDLRVLPYLASPFRKQWNITGTMENVTAEEGEEYAVYGLSSIEDAIKDHDLKELFLIKIQISRQIEGEQVWIRIPPWAMLVLLLVSPLVILKDELADSLRIYLTVAFSSISYLIFLRGITPPVLTSFETLTLIDMLLCFGMAIFAVCFDFGKKWIKDRKVDSRAKA